MEHILRNSTYELKVSDHGAEIRSFKKFGKELMWQADPKFWGRTSPILFPVVGNFYGKEFRYEGRTYRMSQHGFARDRDFALINSSENELLFELTSNEDTLALYPFEFVLQIGYRLSESGVSISWTVKNPANKELLFSIGGHPAFNCDLGNSKLMFYRKGAAVSGKLLSGVLADDGSGCVCDRIDEYAVESGELRLSKELFDIDTLIFEDRQVDEVALLTLDNEELVRVRFDAPLVGIWSPAGQNAPFVCIEPWYGRCDRAGFNKELSEREHGNRLNPGEIFEVSYSIS